MTAAEPVMRIWPGPGRCPASGGRAARRDGRRCTRRGGGRRRTAGVPGGAEERPGLGGCPYSPGSERVLRGRFARSTRWTAGSGQRPRRHGTPCAVPHGHTRPCAINDPRRTTTVCGQFAVELRCDRPGLIGFSSSFADTAACRRSPTSRSRSPISPGGTLARESSRAREPSRLHAEATASVTKCSSVPIVFI